MNIKRINPSEAAALIENEHYQYLDVRSVPEFDAGHPAGAYNIPLMNAGPAGMQPNANFLKVVTAAFPKDANLVVGCMMGGRSKRAVEVLISAGYTNLVDQCAGFGGVRDAFGTVTQPGWQASGLAVSTDAQPSRSYADLAAKAGV